MDKNVKIKKRVQASCNMIDNGPPPMKGQINQTKEEKTRFVGNEIGLIIRIIPFKKKKLCEIRMQ